MKPLTRLAFNPPESHKSLCFGWSTFSTSLWASFSCLSRTLDVVEICIGDKYSSMIKFSASTTRWLRRFKKGWSQTLQLQKFVVVEKICYHPSCRLWVSLPRSRYQSWNMKLVQIYLCSLKIPYSWCKLIVQGSHDFWLLSTRLAEASDSFFEEEFQGLMSELPSDAYKHFRFTYLIIFLWFLQRSRFCLFLNLETHYLEYLRKGRYYIVFQNNWFTKLRLLSDGCSNAANES